MKALAVRHGVLAVASAILLFASPVAAQSVADFYAGKQIKIYIRADPGGNYDTYSRLLGRHITRFIPGKPTALPVNMPGGGGLKALNYVATVAPKDGTVLTMVTQSFPMEQALGLNKSLTVDLRELAWIGNMSNSNLFIYTSPQSYVRSLEDARERQAIISADGILSIQSRLAGLYNNKLGTKFKIIYGYNGAAAETLAMERGEVDGRATSNPLALFPSAEARTDPKYRFHFLIQAGMTKLKEFSDVPLLRDLATNPDEREIFDFVSKAISISRPISTTAAVPPQRVAALRRAFDETVSDAAFLDEAERLGMEISPMTGEELQQIVASLIDEPTSILDQIREAMQIKSSEAAKGAKPEGKTD